jgi:hypothetical protein
MKIYKYVRPALESDEDGHVAQAVYPVLQEPDRELGVCQCGNVTVQGDILCILCQAVSRSLKSSFSGLSDI